MLKTLLGFVVIAFVLGTITAVSFGIGSIIEPMGSSDDTFFAGLFAIIFTGAIIGLSHTIGDALIEIYNNNKKDK